MAFQSPRPSQLHTQGEGKEFLHGQALMGGCFPFIQQPRIAFIRRLVQQPQGLKRIGQVPRKPWWQPFFGRMGARQGFLHEFLSHGARDGTELAVEGKEAPDPFRRFARVSHHLNLRPPHFQAVASHDQGSESQQAITGFQDAAQVGLVEKDQLQGSGAIVQQHFGQGHALDPRGTRAKVNDAAQHCDDPAPFQIRFEAPHLKLTQGHHGTTIHIAVGQLHQEIVQGRDARILQGRRPRCAQAAKDRDLGAEGERRKGWHLPQPSGRRTGTPLCFVSVACPLPWPMIGRNYPIKITGDEWPSWTSS